uniref:Uncharacterized protein n=1 Tax=Romanomermis culicivorax TaxID=13658 RepID=A0A915JB91_ROMCU
MLLICIFLSYSFLEIVSGFKFSNELGKPLVVISAPSFWDAYYKEKFFDLINFDIDLAKAIAPTDNVLVLADRNTLPYLQGRSHEIPKKLPDDMLLEANIYDIFLRDFSPMGIREVLKFHYAPDGMDAFAARQIDKSMMRFLVQNELRWSKNLTLALSGSQVVDNGVDKAIIDKNVYKENRASWQEWALTIQLMSSFKSIALVEWLNETGPLNDNITTRLDDWMAFIDNDMLAISPMTPENQAILEQSVKKSFKNQVKLVEMPDLFVTEAWNNRTGICGLYTNLLMTNDNVYLPVFGNDPENWLIGQSTMVDKMAVEMVQVNTRRNVVPVNMPRKICQIGAGLRSLTWLARGEMADKLMTAARLKKSADPNLRH